MVRTLKVRFFRYSIPCLLLIVIFIQLFLVNTQNLNRWKGGGYGMYSEIHYSLCQIYIPGYSVDSLVKDNTEMKNTLGYLLLMPNKSNLKKAAKHVLKTTKEDSIHIQVWKPKVVADQATFTRELIDEIHLKKNHR